MYFLHAFKNPIYSFEKKECLVKRIPAKNQVISNFHPGSVKTSITFFGSRLTVTKMQKKYSCFGIKNQNCVWKYAVSGTDS